ncbi:thioredoxin-disulfide reductase [Agathobaculum sp.]|uniref:thioredoxin-disulfide reductase n=1 Tax=Agathobaculum sp. TaxID=2048138 RepID=UPI002A7EB4B2|nr:thioredoxin-disulfide reductase [Agathobaculum sp.]MDY3617745.1 thioredoxin-disulfide reductase [Agathobaculum sp.]
MSEQVYDVAVIGGGPGGYTAALYCARSGLRVVVLEKLSAGGQMATTEQIDNYPGFEDGVDGFELGEKMKKGAERFGVRTELEEVTSVDLRGAVKRIETGGGAFEARTVVLATGAYPRELGLPEEKQLRGRGVAYCATCDGMMYRGKTVVVSGGGNTAVADALHLANICKKVYLVHRRDALRASKVYMKALEESGVEIIWNSRIEEILHEKKVVGVRLANVQTGETSELACDGVFVAIGRVPDTKLYREQVETDEAGYLIADETTRTSVPGVFAVGDARTKAVRQIVTATADGANAAFFIEEYLIEQEETAE